MIRKHRFVAMCLSAAVAANGIVAGAGELNPPAGPVGPTHKTITEVEPRIPINATNTPGDADSLFKITQRGSYYLMGNVSGVAGKTGIEIANSGVTLDLNGFDLQGVAGSLDGVGVTAINQSNIAVINGSVRSWGDEGVDLGTFNVTNSRVEGVLASNNIGNGILVGIASTVSNCSASNNNTNGISTGADSTISNCITTSNGGDGILASSRCAVRQCETSGNSIDGLDASINASVIACVAHGNEGNGFRVSNNSTITQCAATGNSLDGFSISNGSSIWHCTAANNLDDGFSLNPECLAYACAAQSNDDVGIDCGVGCTVSQCTASSNGGGAATANKHGIDTAGEARIVDCISRNNDGDGIQTAGGSTVSGCTVTSNDGDGIEVSTACIVTGNLCRSNGFSTADGAGIHTTSSDNRIEGNNCTGADRGMDIDGSGSIIIRNTCSGNATNWDVVAGNVCLVVQGVTGAAIFGNTGGAGPGSTDPNANFTY